MKRILFALAATVPLAFTAPAEAANVNISVDTDSVDFSYYSIVSILGAGGGSVSFAPEDAFLLGDQSGALASLGLAPGTALDLIVETPLASFVTVEETVDAGGAVFGVDYVGDPDDYLTWINVRPIDGDDIFVQVDQLATTFMPYELTATIVSDVTAVPLPAGFGLLAAASGLLLMAGRRAKTA